MPPAIERIGPGAAADDVVAASGREAVVAVAAIEAVVPAASGRGVVAGAADKGGRAVGPVPGGVAPGLASPVSSLSGATGNSAKRPSSNRRRTVSL